MFFLLLADFDDGTSIITYGYLSLSGLLLVHITILFFVRILPTNLLRKLLFLFPIIVSDM